MLYNYYIYCPDLDIYIYIYIYFNIIVHAGSKQHLQILQTESMRI
jgi:hypothetical protein